MTTKTDTYNYNQSPLGATGGLYTTVTAAGLQSTTSGANATSTGVQDNVTMWALANYSFLPAHTATIVIGTIDVGQPDWAGVGVCLTTASSGQGYVAYYRPEVPSVDLYLLIAGTIGGSGSYILNIPVTAFTNGDSLGLSVSGSLLTVFHNGTSIGSVTDTTYTGGQPGLAYEFGNNNSTLIASFIATDAGGAGSTATIAWVG